MSVSSINAVAGVQYNSVGDAAQEAAETKATTMQEAAHGDQQAIRKLAKEQELEQVSAPSPQPGVGGTVDTLA